MWLLFDIKFNKYFILIQEVYNCKKIGSTCLPIDLLYQSILNHGEIETIQTIHLSVVVYWELETSLSYITRFSPNEMYESLWRLKYKMFIQWHTCPYIYIYYPSLATFVSFYTKCSGRQAVRDSREDRWALRTAQPLLFLAQQADFM